MKTHPLLAATACLLLPSLHAQTGTPQSPGDGPQPDRGAASTPGGTPRQSADKGQGTDADSDGDAQGDMDADVDRRRREGRTDPSDRPARPGSTTGETRAGLENRARQAADGNRDDGRDQDARQGDRRQGDRRADRADADRRDRRQPRAEHRVTGDVDQNLSSWPAEARLQARLLISKYGPPQEMTDGLLCWKDAGKFKRIVLTRESTPHDFPKPHHDFLEHTISYTVPAGKGDELSRFDGSCTFDRTRGELSARCDSEAHNALTLNLAHQILMGNLSASEARDKFTDIVMDDMLGKNPKETAGLTFDPPKERSTYYDKATVDGSPQRATRVAQDERKDSSISSEGEVLGLLLTVDHNEITAAKIAAMKELRDDVREYAHMLHTDHGKNTQKTLDLGTKLGLTPLITAECDKLREKGAAQLVPLVSLKGDEFGRAFVAAMIQGHSDALELIDDRLRGAVRNAQVKQHLDETRSTIARHLDRARGIQTDNAGNQNDRAQASSTDRRRNDAADDDRRDAQTTRGSDSDEMRRPGDNQPADSRYHAAAESRSADRSGERSEVGRADEETGNSASTSTEGRRGSNTGTTASSADDDGDYDGPGNRESRGNARGRTDDRDERNDERPNPSSTPRSSVPGSSTPGVGPDSPASR